MMGDLGELALTSASQRLARRWLGARTPRALRLAVALLLVATAAALCGVVALAIDEQQRTERRAEALAHQEQLRARHRLPVAAAPALTAGQARSVDNLVDRLNLPWARLLDDLERFTPTSVALLQLEPDVGNGSLRLLVEAKAAEDVFRYLDVLKSAPSLRQLRVAKYETNVQDPARPARFLLQAELAREPPVGPVPATPRRTVAAAAAEIVR